MINEISENLTMAVGFSKEIDENASQTDDQIYHSVQAMNQSSEGMSKTVKLMEDLTIQSKEISSILSIIGNHIQHSNPALITLFY